MTTWNEVKDDSRFVKVLDHGFVGLLDKMGDDKAIVDAARLSYQMGTKTVNQDRGLIRYLMRHRHTSPFEMAELKFSLKLPIFVMRQLVRHRTSCLAGNVELHFDTGNSIDFCGDANNKMTIESVHSLWNTARSSIETLKLRSVNEDTGHIYHTRITNIWESGIKPVFRLTLENGHTIDSTLDHRYLTSEGWKTLQDALNVRYDDTTQVLEWDDASFSVSEIREEKEERPTHSFSKSVKLEYVAKMMTYDLSVEGPFHNFVANGVTVHNCLNEMSLRYSVMTDEFYVPALDQINTQSKVNNQGRGELVSDSNAEAVQKLIANANEHNYLVYSGLLGLSDEELNEISPDISREELGFDEEFSGIARELARSILPVSGYTELVWKQNLHNLFHMLKLRMDSHAQYEIREYANAIYSLVKPHFPMASEAFEDYLVNAATISGPEKLLLGEIISLSNETGVSFAAAFETVSILRGDEKSFLEYYNMSKRELGEFKKLWSL